MHQGHRTILNLARARANREGWRTLAMFFDPPPSDLLTGTPARSQITTSTRRAELLRGAGADDVIIERFDHVYASQSAREFVHDVLQTRYGAVAAVVGADFRFGQGRQGDAATLRELGLDTLVAEPVMFGGAPVSSTRVRNLLSEGQVVEAARLLMRVHETTGTVVLGDQRGRALGIPTANLECERVLLPRDGVYAVKVRLLENAGEGSPVDRPVSRSRSGMDSALIDGVANLGHRPTFEAGRSVEVHLLDFDEDIYGRQLRVGFVARIRNEQKFSGIEELLNQIAMDIHSARRELSHVDEELLVWI